MGYIIRLSLANIKLRKLRTALTIVGIMIGVMSIVTMLTTGLNAKKTMLEDVEKAGSTKEITVYSQGGNRKDRMLTDSVVAKIAKLDNVTGAYPAISIEGEQKLMGFVAWDSMIGVPIEYMENLPLKDGELPTANGSRPELLIGNSVRKTLFNSKTWQQFSDSLKKDDQLVGQKMDFRLSSSYADYFVTASEYDSTSESEKSESDNSVSADSGEIQELSYQKLNIVGEVDNEYDYNIYTDIDTLKMYLKRKAVNGKIPGQPLDKNGDPYNMWIYDKIIVRVDSVDKVEHVSKVLQDMGYQVQNNLEYLQEVTRLISMIQFILGALGTIAAIVAVIGIINTMMTAVYDRVKEIGLLKMLGSDSDDISFMFLFESALMGFIGGALGVGLSLLVDIYINKRLVEYMKMPEGTWIMTTPAWLIVGAIAAAVIISVLAGFLPARWGSKIKPLDALAMG